jgi:hypothetical protein
VNVSAIIVTRGDVDLTPVVTSIPGDWELLVWDNGAKRLVRFEAREKRVGIAAIEDLSVYGRYAAIDHATGDLIYVQDDDCVVSDPESLVIEWKVKGAYPFQGRGAATWGSDPRDAKDHAVCNMPESRWSDYADSALVGWGSVFHRDAPGQAWARMFESGNQDFIRPDNYFFYRTCDVVFTTLTPCAKVDLGFTHLPWAEQPGRMFTSPGHKEERDRMLELARKVRDQ